MKFTLCENTGFYLRMGLLGPSGSGKSFTALTVATSLGFENIAIIDTENKSARRYAKSFGRRFLSLELSHFSPRDYIEALQEAQRARVEVLIVDSLSHAWAGKGGVLEMVDQSAKRQARGASQNSFNGWREVTPEHNRLVEALIQVPMHLIVTMRVKTEYIVEKDAQGKSVPKKVGMAPVQRDGLEYEFDVVGDITLDHELYVTKSRCPALSDAVLTRPGPELARALRAWIDGGEGAPPPPPDPTPSCSPAPAPAGPVCDCGVPIVFLKTVNGHTAPVELVARDGSAVHGAEIFDVKKHISHFARCPLADQHRAKPDETKGWLKRIKAATCSEQLDAVRAQLNAGWPAKDRTREQGNTLRQAINQQAQKLREAPPAAPAPAPPPVPWAQRIAQVTDSASAALLVDALKHAGLEPRELIHELGKLQDRLRGIAAGDDLPADESAAFNEVFHLCDQQILKARAAARTTAPQAAGSPP